jgi:hypothetical protein
MLNQPIDRETAIFKRDWLRYKDYAELGFKKTRHRLTIDSKGTRRMPERTTSESAQRLFVRKLQLKEAEGAVCRPHRAS